MNDKKKQEAIAGNLSTLRATHNNQVEIVHRYSGERRSIDADTYDDEERFEACGFDANDWVLSREFKGVEPHPNDKKKAKDDNVADIEAAKAKQKAAEAAAAKPESQRTEEDRKLILEAQGSTTPPPAK